ncbi:cation channel sperm-associated auxiliary subunit TMEM249 isoform X2 [Hemicordylus capensis]|uniref:cation channel sperm-associated auxiliary subunit TMEM249 isoform X2 n=1 Tax=Hemicordylus capensis TaxID=884348 RepID=UPI002302AA28|nr:cation channel sperm-associated auxiliary subunit TMEM249 isoform X2 [Hemicordylus capensis]
MMQWFRGRGAPLVLWQCSFWNVEKTLSNKFQQNKHFPFQVQQPNVFVMEYYKESLWKGLLVFLVFLALTIAYFYTASERTQDLSAGLFFGMLMGVWLILSSMNKRRLIINHVKGVYQFYIKGRLWHESPLHQIYVRLMPQSDAHGKLFFSLIINGYHLEMLTLADLSNKYQDLDLTSVTHALVTSRLDYCNALYVGLPLNAVWKHQLVQNAAARMLVGASHFMSATAILRQFHWLPVCFQNRFKVLI